jgi:hypothetical protein
MPHFGRGYPPPQLQRRDWTSGARSGPGAAFIDPLDAVGLVDDQK